MIADRADFKGDSFVNARLSVFPMLYWKAVFFEPVFCGEMLPMDGI